MHTLRSTALLLSLASVAAPALAQDADSIAARGSREGTRAPQAELDQHSAAAASTELASRALRNAIDLEAARWVAPFDLSWGTP